MHKIYENKIQKLSFRKNKKRKCIKENDEQWQKRQ